MRKKILIVNRRALEPLSELLQLQGHSVEEVQRGKEALEAVRRGKHDLIIASFLFDGLSILENVKAIRPAVPPVP